MTPNSAVLLFFTNSTNSDKPSDPKLWTIERFRDEVEAVRKGLGLEQFYLLGHSWGGMLAIEYALAYPQYLDGLIISNMTPGIQAYERSGAELCIALPDDVTRILDKYGLNTMRCHMAMYDDQIAYFRKLLTFLKSA
jgi:proline-specific peptidase